jgi:hypothetical protein
MSSVILLTPLEVHCKWTQVDKVYADIKFIMNAILQSFGIIHFAKDSIKNDVNCIGMV